MEPASGLRKPVMRLNSVVLPDPLPPRRQVAAWDRSWKLTLSSSILPGRLKLSCSTTSIPIGFRATVLCGPPSQPNCNSETDVYDTDMFGVIRTTRPAKNRNLQVDVQACAARHRRRVSP